MAAVPRVLEKTVRRALRTFPAVLVTGARQTGKTTLLRAAFGHSHSYVSLERPDVRARAAADPEGFFAEHPPPVTLDEIQAAPSLLHHVKDRIDADRAPGQWLLTGSQTLPLMREISQTLAGRVAVLTLDPLSVGEAARAPSPTLDARLERVFGAGPWPQRKRLPSLASWLLRGGYPEPRLHPRVDRALWFGSYVQTYLERDVRDLLQVGDLNAFSRFVALVAARSAQLLNLAELGRDAGVTAPTVRSWLSVLEASHIVYLLQPFHANFGKRLVKSPKLYLLDAALMAFLIGLHSDASMLAGPSAGALVETAVVGEWVKAFHQAGLRPPLSFYRSSGGDEVDLVIEYDGELYGLEIKATSTPTPHHADGLVKWMALAGERAHGAVACRVDAPRSLRPGVRAVPWHCA